jgi:hypothetical protein
MLNERRLPSPLAGLLHNGESCRVWVRMVHLPGLMSAKTWVV